MQLHDPSLEGLEADVPVWAAFGDLMACALGVFVLLVVWLGGAHVVERARLVRTQAAEAQATARLVEVERTLSELEQALAGPLESGLITLTDGRIGIRGSVLFRFSSATLRPDGMRLLRELVAPLGAYLRDRDEVLMVSGFTDDVPHRYDGRFADNWELSTERALSVTRALVAAGVPRERVFAAGFADQYAVASNDTAENRARNRRVEIGPIPRPRMMRVSAAAPRELGAP